MTAARGGALYTPEMLGLAVSLADYPISETANAVAEARSQTCGSVLAVSLALKDDGSVGEVGLRVSACAVGQAAAAIFAQDVIGRTEADIKRARDAIAEWLGGDRSAPDWAGLQTIAAARAHPGRHEAILLPWKAALLALSNAQDAR
ncbi:iron-sulfur cluster assembly scaffold protein [Qipengyuania atrilutea]|uniref:Iron-sulfur cluster assembly scaffold protein n=1 Tax=Qipengyuania atrilutea TaxID=2744473 RepID=A0A850H1K2_9SPHN|nr:iron-sulfur cluster assembly scaffold protein [Actirhodobacter atriluteus]NVD43808.1 iron-sulfur cluster assembly scaffold protein [Actirhodobacter atriluteus]